MKTTDRETINRYKERIAEAKTPRELRELCAEISTPRAQSELGGYWDAILWDAQAKYADAIARNILGF